MNVNKDNYTDTLRTISQSIKVVDAIILSLEKASSLANWDLFSGDSLLFGWLKYKRIAEAEARIPILQKYLKILQEELNEMPTTNLQYKEINRRDRLWDTYGDVLFFDFKTRKTIKTNLEHMHNLKMELVVLRNTINMTIHHIEGEE